MSRKASINIKPRSIASSMLHNARVFELSYAVRDKKDNENKLYKTQEQLKNLLREIKLDYQTHSYRNRKLPTNATPIREGVVNLEAHHTIEDVENLAKKIAKKMGVEVLSISIHRDEGKDAENINYHAHILLNYYNFSEHKITHHNASDRIMQQVQDLVAQELNMQRGISKEITRKKHIPHQYFRHIAKEREGEEQEHINTVADLKQKLNDLQNELRAKNNALEEHKKIYTKADYDAINKLKKELKKDTLAEVVESYYALCCAAAQQRAGG